MFEFEYTDINGVSKKSNYNRNAESGKIFFLVNDFALSVGIKIKKNGILAGKKRKISDLAIYMLSMEQVFEIGELYTKAQNNHRNFELSIINQKNDLKNIINDIEQRQKYLDEDIKSKQEKVDSLNSDIEDLLLRIPEIKEVIQALKTQISDKKIDMESLNNRLNILKNSEIAQQRELEILQEKYAILGHKHLGLQKNVNLLPDTLDGFSKRSFWNKLVYLILSLVPLTILSFIFFMAWDAAKNLAIQSSAKTYEAAFSILIQKIPFSLLFFFLTALLITFLYKMVSQLTEVQQQELNLAKISMLARDIADAESSDLTEEAKQTHRMELKIKLIQQYLASEFVRFEKIKDSKSEKHSGFGSIDLPSIVGLIRKNDGKSNDDADAQQKDS